MEGSRATATPRARPHRLALERPDETHEIRPIDDTPAELEEDCIAAKFVPPADEACEGILNRLASRIPVADDGRATATKSANFAR